MMKTTTEPLFSNGTEFMWWQDRNCCKCKKAVWYNEKTDSYPQYKCALQRDIEQQAGGIDEINIRTYNMIHGCNKCPMFRDINEKAKPNGKRDDGQPDLFTANDFARGESMVGKMPAKATEPTHTDTKGDEVTKSTSESENAEKRPKKTETAQINPLPTPYFAQIAPIRPNYGQNHPYLNGMNFDITTMPGIPADIREQAFRQKCKKEMEELLHAFNFDEHMTIAFAPLVIAQMAWMYTFKVLDYARNKRISELKKLSHAVRHVHNEYIAMMRKDLDVDHIRKIEENTQHVHDMCANDFTIMWLQANQEIKNIYRDCPHERMRTDAYMAVLLIRVLKEHNAKMDNMIRERLGRCTPTIMNPWMVKLRDCMDAFTGGADLPFGTQVKMCTQIVHKNIQKIKWETTD